MSPQHYAGSGVVSAFDLIISRRVSLGERLREGDRGDESRRLRKKLLRECQMSRSTKLKVQLLTFPPWASPKPPKPAAEGCGYGLRHRGKIHQLQLRRSGDLNCREIPLEQTG